MAEVADLRRRVHFSKAVEECLAKDAEAEADCLGEVADMVIVGTAPAE
jgi:hypothetical protein